MNTEFNRYWKWFTEKQIRLMFKETLTAKDLNTLKHMRKEREQLVDYINYRGFYVDENDNIHRSKL